MRIKTLFSIPDGEKVTEKALRRVLISSICSILLCMTCLVSTTWAWFAVSIENTGNEIIIATVNPKVKIKQDNHDTVEPSNGSYELKTGNYLVEVELENDATESDAFGYRTGPVYLVMPVIRADNTTENYFIKIENSCDSITRKLIIGDESVNISFSVSWVQPAAANPIGSKCLLIGETGTEQTDTLTTEMTSEPITEDSVEVGADGTEDLTTEATTGLSVGVETDSVAGFPNDDVTEVAADPSTEPSIVPLPE